MSTTTKASVQMKIVTINPQLAKKLLSTSKVNRKIQKLRVARYAQAMDKGEWTIAQPLMMNCEEVLIDGHHRLHAVVAHGKPVDFAIMRGLDAEKTFGVIDDTSQRKLAHWLEIRNEIHAEVLAPVIMLVYKHKLDLVPTSTGGNVIVTPIEGLDFLAENPDIRTAVHECPTMYNLYLSKSMTCFSYWLFSSIDKAAAKGFFIDMVMGTRWVDGDPVYLLRERLKTNRTAKQKMTRAEKLAITIKAWNACRNDEILHNLRWRNTGPHAEKFPIAI